MTGYSELKQAWVRFFFLSQLLRGLLTAMNTMFSGPTHFISVQISSSSQCFNLKSPCSNLHQIKICRYRIQKYCRFLLVMCTLCDICVMDETSYVWAEKDTNSNLWEKCNSTFMWIQVYIDKICVSCLDLMLKVNSLSLSVTLSTIRIQANKVAILATVYFPSKSLSSPIVI